MERLSPSVHCPWLSVVAVLVVVGSIPPSDSFCLENLLFGRAIAVQLGSLGPPKKAIVEGGFITETYFIFVDLCI